MKETKRTVRMYRKDPCPIDYQYLISESMSYLFWGWIIWLVATTLERIFTSEGSFYI